MEKIKKRKVIVLGIFLIAIILAVFVYLTYFKTYTVTFALKIGAGIKTQEVKKGDLVAKPEEPVAEGFAFDGWYLDDKLYDFSRPVEKDLNLEAKWTPVVDK